ncbi:phosphatase PAP2 family protein [Kineosporia babensis]|uniref:Phosphatase PAP2 family protein n=1 Tax=Kineosporia babensis TaxID=499548 RepID=A0A9X1SXE2_9ACTN|nr:phosphatase PAP2 family protein [Kineosporia babensis]MCD5315776.1 phosphatase PAP2 family protein [Kineosporia babensis]
MKHPVAVTLRLESRPGLSPVLREFVLIAGLFGLYKLGRSLAQGKEPLAFQNAQLIRGLEAALHLPSEAWLQSLVPSAGAFTTLNVYYVGVHFPLMIAFLLWGFFGRPQPEYRWARNLLIVQTGLALVVHLLFPLAPPRMFPQWGFLDSMTVYGPSAYDGPSAGVANQFAAMPSLHIGWAVLIAYVVVRTGPRWIAIPAVLHALFTVAVVVLTANHWWLDGVAGTGLLLMAVAVVRPAPGRWT